jgi:hypothetical protein
VPPPPPPGQQQQQQQPHKQRQQQQQQHSAVPAAPPSPLLLRHPVPGDVLSYQLLEIGPDHTPQVRNVTIQPSTPRTLPTLRHT